MSDAQEIRYVAVDHFHKQTTSSGFGAGFGGCLGVLAALFLVFVVLPIGGCVGLAMLGSTVDNSYAATEWEQQRAHDRMRAENEALLAEAHYQQTLKREAEPVARTSMFEVGPEPTAPKYTKQQYQQLVDGMTRSEVVAILGEGVVINQSSWSVMYQWSNDDGSYIMATFLDGIDGKMTAKSQSNL